MANYYVSTTGSDSADGSSGTPWRTIQHAADQANPGDLITVRSGNYAGFDVKVEGTSGSPITFLAESGATITSPAPVPDLTTGINLSGPSYIVIDGFHVVTDNTWGSGIRIGGIFPGGAIPHWAFGNVVRNCNVSMPHVAVGDPNGVCIFASWQNGLQFVDNVCDGGGDSGMYVSNSATNYVIARNLITFNGGNGIHNNGDVGQGGPGIITNALIEDNIIHDVGFATGGQAISCDGVQNSILRNNLIYNASSKGISLFLMNASDGSKNNYITNNTIYSNGSAVRMVDQCTGNTLVNNILASTAGGSYDINSGDGQGMVSDHNVHYSGLNAASGRIYSDGSGLTLDAWRSLFQMDANSLIIAPANLFVNPASDFHLKAGTAAIDAGISGTNVSNLDLDGHSRPAGSAIDIGAYEYGSLVDTTPPTAPSNLTATAASQSQINLTWTAATDDVGVTGYLVERGDSGGANFVQIGTPTATSFSDTGRAASTTYSYRVRATDAAPNLGPYSGTAFGTTLAPDTTPPTAPTNLSATAAGPFQVDLSWTAATDDVGVTGYLVERGDSGGANFSQVGTPSGTSFGDTGRAASTTYSYRVRATDAAPNLGPYSSTAFATTAAIPSGLVAAYGFEEGSGPTSADSSGGNHTASLSNVGWTTSGKNGDAAVFNGTNSRISIPNHTDFTFTNAITVMCWAYPTALANIWTDLIVRPTDNILLAASSDNSSRPNAQLALSGGGNPSVYAPSALAANTWTHLAFTYNGSTLIFYINGTSAGSSNVSGTIAASTNPIQLGSDSTWGQYFTGRIDDVRIYNVVRTQAQIQDDMNSGVGGPPTVTQTFVGQERGTRGMFRGMFE